MKRPILAAQNVSRMCVVCGRDNPFSLKARFYELDDHELLGVFAPLDEHQSYPGRLHGGLSSAILDETIGRAIILHDADAWGVTVEFSARFRRPVPLDEEIRAVGRITRNTSRLFEGTGEILLSDGSVAVEARGKYLRQPIHEIVDVDFETQWFADERARPDEVDV